MIGGTETPSRFLGPDHTIHCLEVVLPPELGDPIAAMGQTLDNQSRTAFAVNSAPLSERM